MQSAVADAVRLLKALIVARLAHDARSIALRLHLGSCRYQSDRDRHRPNLVGGGLEWPPGACLECGVSGHHHRHQRNGLHVSRERLHPGAGFRHSVAGRFGVGALAGFLLGAVIKVETRRLGQDEGLEFLA